MAVPMQHDGSAIGAQSRLWDGATEGFVLSAMALTTITVGTALYTHLPLDLWLCVIFALGLYGTSLAFHGYIRQSEGELVSRPETPEREQRAGGIRGFFDLAAKEKAAAQARADEKRKSLMERAQQRSPAPGVHLPLGSRVPPVPSQHDSQLLPQRGEVGGVSGASQPGTSHSLSPSNGGPVFGPGLERGSELGHSSPATPPPISSFEHGDAPGGTTDTDTDTGSPRDSDVEMIQGLIKKLADQVNSADQAPAVDGAAAAPRATGEIQSPTGNANDIPRSGGTHAGDRGVQASIDALEAAAGSMRTFESRPAIAPISSENEPLGVPHDGSVGLANDESRDDGKSAKDAQQSVLAGRLAALSEALNANRFDVLMDPIVGLTDNRSRHFEVRLQFQDERWKNIANDDLDGSLVGTGLYPMIDSACLSRVEKISTLLEERGRDGHLLTKIAGDSLTHAGFVGDVKTAANTREDFIGRLIMSVSQAHVRRFGRQEWDTIRDLKKLGFRFAITSVSDLDMDFEGCRQRDLRLRASMQTCS